jgi:hypothetical protein
MSGPPSVKIHPEPESIPPSSVPSVVAALRAMNAIDSKPSVPPAPPGPSFRAINPIDAKPPAPQQQPAGQKYKFKDVDDMLRYNFNYKETNNSTICDIIAVYLKGQKILYTEAKTYCEQKLNYLMMPSIILTAAGSVISLALKDYSFGATIVSCLNAGITFILGIITYLKLDAKAEAHRTSAYKFDKLQSYIEFNSGKILFISGESEKLGDVILETEKNVAEIKESNQFVLPEYIRYRYPVLCNTNVFAKVKEIQTQEMRLVNELKDVYNDMIALQSTPGGTDTEQYKALDTLQRQKVDAVIAVKNEYLRIDKEYADEMKLQREAGARRIQLCGWMKT